MIDKHLGWVKSILKQSGTMLSIAGIIFVIIRLRTYSDQINLSHFSGIVWFGFAGMTIIYGFSNSMLAFAWWNLLKYFGIETTTHWSLRTYGISQIAKYVPGNIFHFAGRQTMGMTAGVPGLALLKSTSFELGLMAATAALFGVIAVPLLLPKFSDLLADAIFLILIAALGVCLHYVKPSLARAFSWYVAFFSLSGILFVSLINSIGYISAPWIQISGAYVIAWLVGFATPGAPAGMGVREIILLYLLKGTSLEADLIMSVLVGRGITIIGDLGFFCFASITDETTL